MKCVVITGGAGFVGSHIADLLNERGYHISILDDLSSGRIENIKSLLEKSDTEFIDGSIMDLPLLQRMFQGVEYVFHEAAIPSVPRSIEHPEISHNINATGTLNVLVAARDNRVRKLVFASSTAVYGDAPGLPKVEDMPTNPLSPYAVTKLAGEYYCRVFQELYGLQTVCLRYFNVFGPRQDPKSQYAAAIPIFIDKLNKKQTPVIFGDGEQTRDFIFVKDVAMANLMAAESEATGIFNIALGSKVTIKHLVQLIGKIKGISGIKPEYVEPRPGDIRDSYADISGAANAFHFKPRYGIEEGLRETIDYLNDKA